MGDKGFARRLVPRAVAPLRRCYGGMRSVEILGVTTTPRHLSPDEEVATGTVYFPLPRIRAPSEVLIRSERSPVSLIRPVRTVFEELLGEQRVVSVMSMEDMFRRKIDDREPQLILLGTFAIMTLLLTGIGLFALLSYNVRFRVPEFALRMTMGAQPAHVGKLVLREALYLLVPGLVLGVTGAWLAGHLLSDRLYQVNPFDVATWLAAGFTVSLVAAVASVQPAISAIRSQPVESLRYI